MDIALEAAPNWPLNLREIRGKNGYWNNLSDSTVWGVEYCKKKCGEISARNIL